MRSYTSFDSLSKNSTLFSKVQFALLVVAHEMMSATPTDSTLLAFNKRQSRAIAIIGGLDQATVAIKLILVQNDTVSDISVDDVIVQAVRDCFDELAGVIYSDTHSS